MITQFFRALFRNKKAAPAQSCPSPPADAEIAELRETVFDLLVEVEAMRRTLLHSPLASGGARSPYAIAYRDTAYLTHDTTGCSGSRRKLLAQFYPHAQKRRLTEFPYDMGEEREWRECLFMQRLGMSPEDIAQYQHDAAEAETNT